jgi:sortase A
VLVVVGLILVTTGIHRVQAGELKGFSQRTGWSLSETVSPRLVATAQPAYDLISPYLLQPSPTPFQPAERSRIQELLKPQSRPTPLPVYIPDSISIPVIKLEAGIEPVGADIVETDGSLFQQWNAPNEFAAGWHDTSAPLGRPGNTVLNGHNNIYGEVFKDLEKLKPGDKIILTSGRVEFLYQVTNSMKLKEANQSMENRLENARWIEPTSDERLTLVTCWPYTNNTYRWVVVAVPTGSSIRSESLTQ